MLDEDDEMSRRVEQNGERNKVFCDQVKSVIQFIHMLELISTLKISLEIQKGK
jgi:hypothetical protein